LFYHSSVSNSSYSPLAVTPSEIYPNLASTLALMSANNSNSSLLASVATLYSSATASHKAIASFHKF
jgi:hypothetical protein